ncbi:MAG: hypothetical protein WD269_12315 [Acidimicrobiia bacterium]
MARVRFFADPSESESETPASHLGVAVEYGMEMPKDDSRMWLRRESRRRGIPAWDMTDETVVRGLSDAQTRCYFRVPTAAWDDDKAIGEFIERVVEHWNGAVEGSD